MASKQMKGRQVINMTVKTERSKPPKEERNEEIRAVFNIFDADGDGYISCKELESFLYSIGRSSKKEDIDRLLKETDKDKNGKISLDEFEEYMDKFYVAPQDEIQDVVDAFKIFDFDNNGYISAQEFKDILTKFGRNQFTDEEIDGVFDLIDLNKDGRLDYAEFIDMWKYR